MTAVCTMCKRATENYTVANGNLMCMNCYSNRGTTAFGSVPGTDGLTKTKFHCFSCRMGFDTSEELVDHVTKKHGQGFLNVVVPIVIHIIPIFLI